MTHSAEARNCKTRYGQTFRDVNQLEKKTSKQSTAAFQQRWQKFMWDKR